MRVPSIVSAAVFCGAIAAALSPALAQRDVRPVRASQANGHWIGVRCFDLPEVVRAQLDVAENQGVLVDDVVAGSPAEKAGLRRFDVIVTIAGEPVASPLALADAVAETDGNELAIEYFRAGQKQSLKITPELRPTDFPHDEVERAMRRWLEQPDRPMSMRFFHPGMVLPPGAAVRPALPDDMTVTLEKKGGEPARVLVERGDKRWEAREDALDDLPAEARHYLEGMFGGSPHDLRAFPAGPHRVPGTRATSESNAIEELQQKVDELQRKVNEIDDMKQQIKELRRNVPAK